MTNFTPQIVSHLFGYKTKIAQKTISVICSILEQSDKKAGDCYESWLNLFQIVGGYKKEKIKNDLDELLKYFSIPKNIEHGKVLFAFHTYYSILVRWITVKIILGRETDIFKDDHFDPQEIKSIFKKFGISNFGDTEYFDWFYSDLSNELLDCFHEMHFIIQNIKWNISENVYTCDLFKTLYQNLFPPKVRHSLGEYYTPEWVTELSIKNTIYNYDIEKKVLDPSCGSGTFLVHIINGIVKDDPKNIDQGFLIQKILNNVVGFDLNPLAVLSAKANYILAIKRFLPINNESDIPIYQFDSITCGDYEDKNNQHSLFKEDLMNKNEIILDKSPSPHFNSQTFDFIFGNPPWINWKFLPDYYRNSVLPIAEKFLLFCHRGLNARLGFAQDDLSVILTYNVIDRFLKDEGYLSFVLPQTLFKTVGGGEGFRQFKLGESGKDIKVVKVIDLTNFKVFDSSASKSSVFICQKGSKTTYPVPYEIWIKKNKEIIKEHNCLDQVITKVEKMNYYAEPVAGHKSNWITADKEILNIIKILIKPSYYRARAGVCTWASSIYWGKKESEFNNITIIKNYTETAKYKQDEQTIQLESDLVFPLVRGRDISRWHFISNTSIILPQFEDDLAKAMSEPVMKNEFPKTYEYFVSHKDFLKGRKGYQKFLSNQPFYAVYDIGPYSFNHYKVAWKYLDIDLRAVVLNDKDCSKPYIPDLNVISISTASLEEAHYIASFLNSTIIRIIIHTFGLCTRITPGILQFLPIDKFEKNNEAHNNLVEISRECHIYYNNDVFLEKSLIKIDMLIKRILKIDDECYKKIKKSMDFYTKK